ARGARGRWREEHPHEVDGFVEPHRRRACHARRAAQIAARRRYLESAEERLRRQPAICELRCTNIEHPTSNFEHRTTNLLTDPTSKLDVQFSMCDVREARLDVQRFT